MSTNTLEPENQENMHEKLQKIKDQEGIIGYILRSSKSASIDLKDPTKIIDYAILSSTVFDLSDNITKTLHMNQGNTMIVESEKTKLVSMNTDKYQLSIFMKSSVDHKKICKSLK